MSHFAPELHEHEGSTLVPHDWTSMAPGVVIGAGGPPLPHATSAKSANAYLIRAHAITDVLVAFSERAVVA
jgi:hypothetical protein